MSIYVELLDQAGRSIGEPRYIQDVAAVFLDNYLGSQWRNADYPFLLLMPYPCEDNDIQGEHPLAYRTDAVGYIQVQVQYGFRSLYRHPHTVAEVLKSGLMRWIKELDDPSEAVAFRISGPEISPLIHQSAPIPRFVTEITPYAAGEKPAFRIRPIPPEAPESARLADFAAVAPDPAWGEQAGHTDFIKVLINPQVEEELLRLRPFSSQAEEGGFLLGQVHEDLEQPETFILSISAAVAAEQVGASFLHFTFTGDSFERIKQRLSQEHRDSRLLGWYHTHLFPATETIGLSSIDFRLHFTTFRIPWQVAGLLNLDGSGRILRFYVRRRDTMLLCHHQTAALERRL